MQELHKLADNRLKHGKVAMYISWKIMLRFCQNADCAGNFSFNYFYVFLKIKFIVNIQTKIFDVLLYRDQ